MRKIIAIGESVLDIVFSGNQPVKAMTGGRIANAAASLGLMGLPVTMVSECCADRVGDLVVDFLRAHHVNVDSVDRFTDGMTALATIFQDEDRDKILNYGRYPADRFDVVWPRIDEDDIVLFGSLYAIDPPQRERLYELLQYAAERKAVLVYLPGFQHGINFRITRVMTAILENLEISSIVVAHERDINDIFPGETATQAYHNHIEFYCNTYVHINPDLSVTLLSGNDRLDIAADPAATPTRNLLGWQAGFTAGIIAQVVAHGLTRDTIAAADAAVKRDMILAARQLAEQCAQAADNCITPQAGEALRQAIVAAQREQAQKQQ